jgi:hypothetical protein
MSNHEDYAHVRDPQSERTKWELWAIVAIVVVVVAGGILWRAVTNHPGKPQTNWNHNTAASSGSSLPAAAADPAPH